MCVCADVCVCGCMREDMHGKISWSRPWRFRRLIHCEIGAEITKLRLERTHSVHPPSQTNSSYDRSSGAGGQWQLLTEI